MSARREIISVLKGGDKIFGDEPHALERDPVRHRMIGGGAIGLETVGEGIHARCRGESRGEADREFRIRDDGIRLHGRMENDALVVVAQVDNDGGPSDLARTILRFCFGKKKSCHKAMSSRV